MIRVQYRPAPQMQGVFCVLIRPTDAPPLIAGYVRPDRFGVWIARLRPSTVSDRHGGGLVEVFATRRQAAAWVLTAGGFAEEPTQQKMEQAA